MDSPKSLAKSLEISLFFKPLDFNSKNLLFSSSRGIEGLWMFLAEGLLIAGPITRVISPLRSSLLESSSKVLNTNSSWNLVNSLAKKASLLPRIFNNSLITLGKSWGGMKSTMGRSSGKELNLWRSSFSFSGVKPKKTKPGERSIPATERAQVRAETPGMGTTFIFSR